MIYLFLNFTEAVTAPEKYQFPIQKNHPNCGAYTLAYYIWAIHGGAPEKTEGTKALFVRSVQEDNVESDFVTEIYKVIKLQTPVEGIGRDDSNPARMMKYLESKGVNSDFYITPQFESVKEPLLQEASAKGLDPGHIKSAEAFEGLNEGQFFIGIFAMETGLHFILYKKEEGKLYCINPHNGLVKIGVLTPGTPSYEGSTGGVYTGAGILIL